MGEGWDILSPERSFTNIWKLCGGFEVVEDEDEVEEDRERTILTLPCFVLYYKRLFVGRQVQRGGE